MSTLLQTPTSRTFDRLNQMLEETFGQRWEFATWTPAMDVKETDKEFKLEMELPGFKKEEVDIQIARDVLTISGKREEKVEEKENGGYLRRERKYGEFVRSFLLNAPVNPKSVNAEFKDGVLMITVPKMEPVQAHKVAIKA